MGLEQEIAELRDAHRALAARNEALFQYAKIMFALIPGDMPTKRRLLKSVRAATVSHMQSASCDDQYQSAVVRAMNELDGVILLAGG
jgi:hypothetical protein